MADFAGNHNGGMLAFDQDGMLLIGTGDGGGGGDPEGNGQDDTQLLGKLLRIDVDGDEPYAVPANDPDGRLGPDARPEIRATGLRNPWRFSVDRRDRRRVHRRRRPGRVGGGRRPARRRRAAGTSAGRSWRAPTCFEAATCDQDGLTLPVAAYSHCQGDGCTIIGGYVYRGAAFPALTRRVPLRRLLLRHAVGCCPAADAVATGAATAEVVGSLRRQPVRRSGRTRPASCTPSTWTAAGCCRADRGGAVTGATTRGWPACCWRSHSRSRAAVASGCTFVGQASPVPSPGGDSNAAGSSSPTQCPADRAHLPPRRLPPSPDPGARDRGPDRAPASAERRRPGASGPAQARRLPAQQGQAQAGAGRRRRLGRQPGLPHGRRHRRGPAVPRPAWRSHPDPRQEGQVHGHAARPARPRGHGWGARPARGRVPSQVQEERQVLRPLQHPVGQHPGGRVPPAAARPGGDARGPARTLLRLRPARVEPQRRLAGLRARRLPVHRARAMAVATRPGDPFGNGQDKDDLFGSILRIDVDEGSPYAIPRDNPFAKGRRAARSSGTTACAIRGGPASTRETGRPLDRRRRPGRGRGDRRPARGQGRPQLRLGGHGGVALPQARELLRRRA